MIDIKTRRKAAEVARHFISGQITNFDLENQFPTSEDPVIRAIEDSLWCFYDDFEEHKLKGKWKIPQETKNSVLRWILFLYSKQEYKWPKISYPGIRPIRYGFLGKLFKRDKYQQKFLSTGDIRCWPFVNKKFFQNTKNNPVLLSGS